MSQPKHVHIHFGTDYKQCYRTFPNDCIMKTSINSFVFFDIETTGLPWQERNQTKIIELSLVAVHTENLFDAPCNHLPEVSKITFLLNPQRSIHPQVVKLTGLSNEMLQNAPTFKQKFNNILSFLKDLPQPICLVAHNGNIFDYKILLAECIDAGVTLPDHLLCVDSLAGFRNLLRDTDICYDTLKPEMMSELPSHLMKEFLTDDEDSVSEEDWPELDISKEEWEEIDEICTSFSDLSYEDFSDMEHEKHKTKDQDKIKQKRSASIRNLFNKKPKVERECFKLSALYKRLLNKEADNAHRAEGDCFMLLECVLAVRYTFLPWASGAAKKLNEIAPLERY